MSEISLPSTVPLRDRLPSYGAHLEKLDARRLRLQARTERHNEKAIHRQLQRELGIIGILSDQGLGQLDSECYIIGHDPLGRRGNSIRATHLAWDLGLEDDAKEADDYAPHLYLSRGNRLFYRGDQGNARPHSPVISAHLLERVIELRHHIER